MTDTARRALIYVRASLDATGRGESVERQERACRALADARGWQVVDVVSDNSVSAYSGRRRPGWQRVLAAVEGGACDVVVAWHLDRLTRSMSDLETLISLADRHGVGVATATGDIDLTTDAGRMVARILAAVARAEVERKAARQQLANRARAHRGEPHRSGIRAFGYSQDGREIIPEEGQAIRDAATAILAGESIASIAEEWNRRGLRTTRARQTGGAWQAASVSRTLRNPRYAGRRIYRGEDVGAGDWPPLLPLDQWAALQAVLSDPRRRRGRSHGRTPSTLLGGLAVCGVCGGTITATSSRGALVYKCRERQCAYLPRGPVDAWVAAHTIELVGSGDILALLAPSGSGDADSARREIATARERLNGLAAAYAAGAIDLDQLETASAGLRAAVAAAEDTLATLGRGSAVEGLRTAPSASQWWEGLSLARQRAAVAALFRVELRRHPRPMARPVVWGVEELAAAVRVEVREE